MELTITLPALLAVKLQNEAQAQQRSAEEIAVDLIDQALRLEPRLIDVVPLALDDVVARIRSFPPNPANQFDMEARMKALGEYLEKSLVAEAEDGQEFDLEAWQRDWDAVEKEMKAITRANDIAEGRA